MESSSDEECMGNVVQSSNASSSGLQGYMFEPKKRDQGRFPARKATAVRQRVHDVHQGRLQQDIGAWCKCDSCCSETLKQDRECLCCEDLSDFKAGRLEQGKFPFNSH